MKRTQRLLATGAGVIAVVSVALGNPAVSQEREGFRPVVTDRNAGLPDAGVDTPEMFMNRRIFDSASPRPLHPPIDQIPPMPMPEFASSIAIGIKPVVSDNRMVFHDSETGLTQVSDMLMPSGLIGGQSFEGDYRGVMPVDDFQNPAAFGNMVAAGGLGTWPRSGNVKLVMRFTDTGGTTRWFVCSGSMQDPGVVLTAAHCVYARSPNGIDIFDWAEIVYVYPAWDGVGSVSGGPDFDEVIQNFGYAFGTSFSAGSGYVNSGDWDRDAGLIRISRGTSRNVGMLTGWYAWAWGGSCATIQSRTYNNFSYPSENCPTPGLHNGRTMYYWNGTIDSCPGNQMQLDTGGNCLDTVWGGMSGSGMYYTDGGSRYVHAVCSTSNRNDVGRYCKLWEQFVLDMQSFEGTTRTNSEDWEPLMMRARGSTTVQAGTTMNDSFDVKMVNATNFNPGSQDYRLRVYLSTNNNISSGDTLLATWDWNNRNFGAMANVNFNVPAPNIPIDTAPGTYWIGVIADSGLPGTSSNDDTDTWDAQQITVTVGLPGAASVVSPANGASGVDNNANLNWVVGARASNSTLYFGTDPTPDAGELIATANFSSWSLPLLSYSTTYYWRVDSNNSAGTTTGSVWSFTIEAEPAPDLRAASITYVEGSSYYAGQMISGVIHRTWNDGVLAASGVGLDFYASTNNFISVFDTLIGVRNYGALNPGSSYFVSSSFTLPVGLSPGDYYLGYIAADTGGVETNLANNWVSGAGTITILQPCQVDLNQDGTLNFVDVSTFVALFSNQDMEADFNGDGVINFVDVSAFVAAFTAGCP